jgi:hypothetical protein
MFDGYEGKLSLHVSQSVELTFLSSHRPAIRPVESACGAHQTTIASARPLPLGIREWFRSIESPPVGVFVRDKSNGTGFAANSTRGTRVTGRRNELKAPQGRGGHPNALQGFL